MGESRYVVKPGHDGVVAKAVAVLGGVIILAAMTVGVWPQRVHVLGTSHDCRSAIFMMVPMDQRPQEPGHSIDVACDDHDRKALGLTFGLGFVGTIVLAGGIVLEYQRRRQSN
jgi:hypothetical protein